MGSQGSKAAKADGNAADTEPAKANGQENGHLRFNGDMTPKVGGQAVPLNGNGSAEPLKEENKEEEDGGDTIEPAPPAEGGEAQPEGAAAPKDTPKKKKKFSFKKSFKLSGISFRKNKKEAGDSSGSSPTEDQGKAEARGEENPTCSGGGTEPSAPPEEGTAEEEPGKPEESPAEGQQGAEPKREDAEAGGSKEEEKQQAGESHGDTAKPEEPSKPAEPEPTPAPAEQKEE
ncbi:MARCKS-related protein [Indicator indicator]|uniref:MARCKS-related protein n=1 Tax=Indicator indicator TaxID=1002788 RepID=UPI0023E036B5|nr:MARCKS-related protein [Indicator indicator]